MIFDAMGGYNTTSLHQSTDFTIRTDHVALIWLMNLTYSTGRLMRWRLRLSGFDFTTTYRPGRVHRVPVALSRSISLDGNDDKTIYDEIPTYRDNEYALVTTRQRSANNLKTKRTTTNAPPQRADRRRRESRKPTDLASDDEDEERVLNGFDRKITRKNAENDDEVLYDVLDEDLDIFDLAIDYTDDGRNVQVADVRVKHTRIEILDAK